MAKLLCFKDLEIFLGVAINRDAAIKREIMIYCIAGLMPFNVDQ